MNRIVPSLLAAWAVFSVSLGKDFWEKKSFTEWSRKEVLKILEDSPWADRIVFTRQIAGRNATLISGERELFDAYTVRLFSALPVRQAYVRMYQILNKYDAMTPQQKEAFDVRFSRALQLDTSQSVIVALEFQSNDRQLAMTVHRNLSQLTAEQFKQSAYLISDRLGRVELVEYYPPAPDGTGAKFIFPRQVDGVEVLDPSDKELKFELYVPGTDHKVLAIWKVKNMTFGDRIEY